MRALEKNIKGFNLLELIAVIVIIGIVSAAAYPQFSDWKKKRESRDASLRIKSLILGINAQVQRGLYVFVQVYVNVTDSKITIVSKGMKSDTLASKINNGAHVWNTDPSTRCNIISTTYWDDDGGAIGNTKAEVQKLELDRDKYATNFTGEGAVCFSKNAQWYSGAGVFGDTIVDERMFICIKPSDITTCAVDEGTGEPTVVKDNLYSIDWTRFGEVTVDKWSTLSGEWVLQ